MDGERHYAKSGNLGYRKIRRRKHFRRRACAPAGSLKDLQEELEDQRQERMQTFAGIKKEEKEARAELKELKQGKKAYPRELEEARFELRNCLHERCGKFVNVHILADLLDVKDERWHNAVEGYLGNNKLQLIVEPKYARAAMDIYQEMDTKRFFRAAVLDTEKLTKDKHQVQPGALAEVVKAKEAYVQEYINFFLGNVKNANRWMNCVSAGSV